MTFIQRHDVASTLRRRCIKVMCPLGSFLAEYSLLQKEIEVQECKQEVTKVSVKILPRVSSPLYSCLRCLRNSFGAKFQTTFVVCFFILKQTMAW